MATDTLSRQPGELPRRSALVTIHAFERGVSAHQWKSIQMLLNLLRVKIPALHGVALLAIRSKLASMNICVAIRAMSACIRKHETRMAFGALHALVHAKQGKFRSIMIEFRVASDRLPSAVCVAIFAGHVDRAVWIVRSGSLRCCPGRHTAGDYKKEGEQQ